MDFKLWYVYLTCMMLLLLFGRALSLSTEIGLTMGIVIILVSISMNHRRKSSWRWQLPPRRNYFLGLAQITFGGLFLFAATPLFPPTSSKELPLYLAMVGILVFCLLESLKIVALFPQNAEDPSVTVSASIGEISDGLPSKNQSPGKQLVRVGFCILCITVGLISTLFMYEFGMAYKTGSPTPTRTQTEELRKHGKIVYTTPEIKRQVSLLETFSMSGIPLALMLGFILQFVFKVEVFKTKQQQ